MPKNQTLDMREVMSGADGVLFVEHDGKNICLAELASFSVTMNVNGVQRQPVGSTQNMTKPVSFDCTLTITEMTIRDDVFMKPLLDSIKSGVFPVFNFQTRITKADGQEQRIALNNCVPSGNFSLLNVTPGEIIEREMNFAVNSIPEYLSHLTSTYLV